MQDLATDKTHLILVNAVIEKDGKVLLVRLDALTGHVLSSLRTRHGLAVQERRGRSTGSENATDNKGNHSCCHQKSSVVAR